MSDISSINQLPTYKQEVGSPVNRTPQGESSPKSGDIVDLAFSSLKVQVLPVGAFQQNSLSPTRFNLAKILEDTACEAASLETKLAEHVEGEIIVKMKPGQSRDAINAMANDYGAKVIYEFDIPESIKDKFGGDLVHMKLQDGMTTAQGIAAMSHDPRVTYAVTNDILHAYGSAVPVIPNDPEFSKLWGLNNTGQTGGKDDADIDAPEAWLISTGKNVAQGGPLICVIDTGIDYNHSDLKDNIWTNPGEIPGDKIDNDGNGVVDDVHGYNAITGSGDPMDDHYHGTHCSGTIGGRGDNNEGVAGVNWNASMMGSKFLSGSGSGTLADAVKAILYATKMGARITSNSWGGGGYNQALKDAFACSPALHVIAAGNSSNDNDANPSYPGSYDLPNIVCVAATNHKDELASFSNWGAKSVDLGAPGVDIYSTVTGNKYKSLSGTSMATPHVTGAVALILSQYPGLTNEQVVARLLNSVEKIPSLEGKVLTGGRLNIANALETDEIAPNAPSDFAASSEKPGEVVLRWTATGDDGMIGKASSYVIRYSDHPIAMGDTPAEGEVKFEDAKPLPAPRPSEPGTAESFIVTLPLSGREKTYYFAIRVGDNVGNFSAICTSSATVPAAKVAFEDDFETNNDNFSGEGWGKVTIEGRGKVWTDSPEGNYGNNVSTSLTSKPISLAGSIGTTLCFDSKVATEARFDKVHVEVAEVPRDGQETQWTEVATYDGNMDWGSKQIDISAFDGKNIQLRYRLTTDGSVTGDGFYLDNLVIVSKGAHEEPKP